MFVKAADILTLFNILFCIFFAAILFLRDAHTKEDRQESLRCAKKEMHFV